MTKELDDLDALKRGLSLKGDLEAAPVADITSTGFQDIPIDLSDANLDVVNGGGVPLNANGFGIQFLRRGSTPGALLQLSGGVGMKAPFAPGDSFGGRFDTGKIVLKLAPGSAEAGTALLRVWTQPRTWFRESPVEVPIKCVPLMGGLTDAGVPTYVTINEDVDPNSGLIPGTSGSFNIGGWSRILVLIDTTSNGGTATSFALCPFYSPPSTLASPPALWFDQGGTALIPVADSAPVSGGRYRVVEINLSQAQGYMYLGVRQLLAAARTGLDLCVLGVL